MIKKVVTVAALGAINLCAGDVDLTQAHLNYPELSPFMRPISAEVMTGDEAHFLLPEDIEKAKLVLKNHGQETLKGMLSVGLRERSDDPVVLKEVGVIELTSGGEYELFLGKERLGERLGIRYCEWRFAPEGKAAIQGVTTFAILRPVGITLEPPKGFLIGTHTASYWRDEKYGSKDPGEAWRLTKSALRANAMIGSEVVRTSFLPGYSLTLDKDPTKWDFTKKDAEIEQIERYGMKVGNMFGYCENYQNLPPDFEKWKVWIRFIGQRFQGRAAYHELFNEPDLWKSITPEEMALYQKIHFDELKAVDPTVPVMTSGFGGYGSVGFNSYMKNNVPLIAKVMQDGNFDLLAWHRHGTGDWYMAEFEQYVLPMMKQYGVKQPVFITESGAGKGGGVFGDEYWACEVVQSPIYTWSLGGAGWIHFCGAVTTKYLLHNNLIYFCGCIA